MLDLEERNRARKKAMRLLEHMDRTEKGLTDKLRQAEFSPEAVEDAIVKSDLTDMTDIMMELIKERDGNKR